ncbi:MAG: hypothetical protein GKR91_00870 [Pseudomonadales bacterium]|nr:hypothetical protein [Pseudomonadales bacterium]
MKIVADADLFQISTLFGHLGNLELVPGREIESRHLTDADALIVRSITDVSEELLQGSSIQFVGSATSGLDHIDSEYLSENGIHLADAKGSNANAVVDYCFAALDQLGYLDQARLNGLRVGIVGYGAIGSLLANKLATLGASIKVNDPPLEQDKSQAYNFGFSSLEEIANCDVVSLHTPLSKSGEFPTENLIKLGFLDQLPQQALLLNSCRGGVVDERAVLALMEDRPDLQFVFDVWDNEPQVSEELVARVDIATPHIAGYSLESKLKAVSCLRDDFVSFFELEKTANKNETEVEEKKPIKVTNISEVLEQSFSIAELSDEFKEAASNKRVFEFFDQARKELLKRRELKSLALRGQCDDDFEIAVLEQLGVTVN